MTGALRVELVNASDEEAAALAARLSRDGVASEVVTASLGDVIAAGHPGDAHVVVLLRRDDPERVRDLCAALPDAWVVVVTPSTQVADLRHLIQAGADGILAEDDWLEPIAPMIGALRTGLLCIPTFARGALGPPPALTLRERQVLGLLTDGLTNAQIAQRLYLSESTVKTHVTAAFRRLGVNSRREAVALINGSGWNLHETRDESLPQQHLIAGHRPA